MKQGYINYHGISISRKRTDTAKYSKESPNETFFSSFVAVADFPFINKVRQNTVEIDLALFLPTNEKEKVNLNKNI